MSNLRELCKEPPYSNISMLTRFFTTLMPRPRKIVQPTEEESLQETELDNEGRSSQSPDMPQTSAAKGKSSSYSSKLVMVKLI